MHALHFLNYKHNLVLHGTCCCFLFQLPVIVANSRKRDSTSCKLQFFDGFFLLDAGILFAISGTHHTLSHETPPTTETKRT